MTEFHANIVEATVVAELPQRLYRLEVATPPGSVLTAGLSVAAQRHGVHIRTGQRVLVQRASLDPSRGIITGVAQCQPPVPRHYS